jgi:Organic Anion Transporter Polypeptide (OATP) family
LSAATGATNLLGELHSSVYYCNGFSSAWRVKQKFPSFLQFSQCSCLEGGVSSDNVTFSEASIGYCPLQCSNFKWYIVLFSVFVFVHSTSEVGSMLLILRCVDPRDKAMALGLIQFAIGLFGNVPCPIVYGAVVDSACLVWDVACGERGACWLYDSDVFRVFFHGEYFNF